MEQTKNNSCTYFFLKVVTGATDFTLVVEGVN